MPIYEITEQQVIDKVRNQNPWWKTSQIDTYNGSMRRRLYFDTFFPLILKSSIKRAIVLMGPRRVGKTVMIYHSIQELITRGIDPQRIFYINVETPLFNNIGLEILLNYCKKAVNKEQDTEELYLFFDEIQYLKEWEVHLKDLVDSYHNIRFVVSGSSAAALRMKSKESGAGRFTDFTLPPLTFHEYIHLKGYERLIYPFKKIWKNNEYDFYNTFDINALNNHFIDYINFGGYPEISLSDEIRSSPERYVKNDIINKIISRDLPGLYGINDTTELNSLFTTIAFNSGNEFSYESLSNSSGISKATIKNYIEFLEAAFLIKTVNRIDKSGKRFKRVNFFKIYLTNPSMRSALISPINSNSEAAGNMVETAIYSQWFHRHWQNFYYARWDTGEVDIVGLNQENLKPAWAVEIKWSNNPYQRPEKLKKLTTFLTKNKLDDAIVTTIDIMDIKTIRNHTIDFIPASVYCYTIGKRTLE